MNTPEGSSIVVGVLKKKQRMDARLARSIAELTASVPEVQEAYLFGCLLPGMSAPAEVLTLVFSPSCEFAAAISTVSRDLRAVLPPRTHLDVWPITPANSIVGSVRLLGRKLFTRSPIGEPIFDEPTPEAKKWWQF